MLETLGGFVVSFLVNVLLGWLGENEQSSAQEEVGRLQSDLDHALAVLKQQQAMAEVAAQLATRAEVLARLEEGSA